MNNSLFYTDAKMEGRVEGRVEGREEGIRGAIEIMLEMNCTESDIIHKLAKTYGLSEEEAKVQYDEYVGQEI